MGFPAAAVVALMSGTKPTESKDISQALRRTERVETTFVRSLSSIRSVYDTVYTYGFGLWLTVQLWSVVFGCVLRVCTRVGILSWIGYKWIEYKIFGHSDKVWNRDD